MFGFRTGGGSRYDRRGRLGSPRTRPRGRLRGVETLESRRVLSISGGVWLDQIDPVADTDQVQFEISAADLAAAGGEPVVTVSVSAGSGSFKPQAALYDPGNDRIGSVVAAGEKGTFRLSVVGRYTIEVKDSDNRDTGDFTVGLEGLNPLSTDAATITLGDVKTGTLLAGEVDAYSFTAAVGDVLTLSLAQTESSSSGYFPRAELYHAVSGERIALNSTTTSGTVREVLAGHRYVSDPLTRAGKYVIQVYDNNYTQPGSYAVALEGLKPASPDAVLVARGEVKSGAIGLGEIDAYRFLGAAGDLVTISLSDLVPGASTELWAELYAPSGQKVPKLNSTPGDHEVLNGNRVIYQLPENASASHLYVIQVYDNDYKDAEDYALALEGLSPVSLDAQPIARGQTVTGTIDQMGEVDAFHFTLSAEDFAVSGGVYSVRLTFASEDTVDYKPRASLLGPSGREVDSLRPRLPKVLALTEPGRYVVQVADDDYTHTKQALIDRGKAPEYSLTVEDAAPPRVLEVALSDPLLTDADLGTAVVVTVIFSESMDPAAVPSLAYTPAVASGTTATLVNPSSGVWTQTAAANDTFTVQYQLADRNVEIESVRVGVSGAKDLAGNLQQAYLPEHELKIDTRNPAVSLLAPPDNATRVAWDAKLSMTFDQPIQKNGGELEIRRVYDDALVAAVPIASDQVTIINTRASIDPRTTFSAATEYYVQLSAGAFRDVSGNGTAVLQGKTAWNFTTVSQAGLHAPSVVKPLSDLTFSLGATERQVDVSGVFDDLDIPQGDSLRIGFDNTAGNTNSLLVSGQLDGGKLNLSFVSGVAGSADLTVTCTDLAGQTVSDTFTVRVVAAPVALDDEVTTDEDQPVVIPVTANDSDADGPIKASTIAVVPGSGPEQGTLVIDNGVIIYTPPANFFGTESFRYTIRDDDGFFSNQATVVITVVEVADFHNSWLRGDVNDSGEVSPLDALTVINYINALGFDLPPDPIPPAQPAFYYDVDGDDAMTPRDVLEIINILNSTTRPAGEGEQRDGDLLALALESLLESPEFQAAADGPSSAPGLVADGQADPPPPAASAELPEGQPPSAGRLADPSWSELSIDVALTELGLDPLDSGAWAAGRRT